MDDRLFSGYCEKTRAPVTICCMAELDRKVYDELRAMARSRLAQQNAGHTLQPTALVHEAWLKLRNHYNSATPPAVFFATAADAMRQILIDHARAKHRLKRGGGAKRENIELTELTGKNELTGADDPEQVLALDEAISKLEALDPQAGQIVKLRFFAGLNVEETAKTLGISDRTVKRDWQFARNWLLQQLSQS